LEPASPYGALVTAGMTRRHTTDHRRTLATLAVAGLLLACSGSDDDADDASGDESAPTTAVAGAAGGDEAIAAAEAFLDDWDRLDEAGRASLSPGAVDVGPGVTHVHFPQSFADPGGGDDIPVRGAEVIVHVDDDGEVIGANSSYTDARPIEGIEQAVEEAEAIDTAEKAAPGEVIDTVSARVVWLPDGDALRLGWSVTQTTTEGGSQVWVDAVSGEVADTRRLRLNHHRTPAAPARAAAPAPAPAFQEGEGCDLDDADAPAACVFLPDPFFANGGDTPDVDETDELLTEVELLGLDDPESGELVGEFVDTDPPGNPEDAVVEDDALWSQGRGEPGFESAMVYFWIDRVQRMIQDAGFDDVRNESFPVIPVDPDVENNAFFDGAAEEIHMGVGPQDGINEGEDANGIVHEYGHAVLDAQVPAMIGQGGDAGAYHEGFGDLLAVLASLEFRDGDAPCLFIWTDQACLRRVDTDKVYPDDIVNIVHDDGEIYTGAVFDVLEALLEAENLDVEDCPGTDDCNEVRDRVFTTLLASHEFLTGSESLPEIATAFQQANDTAFDGADAELIAAAFEAHGLTGGDGGVVDPDGEPTGEPADVELRVDISHSFRGDLRIELHVVDEAFEDLCEPLVLLEPDGQDSRPDVIGAVDISESDCADLAPPAEDRQWVLSVVDEVAQDAGSVNAFQVVVQGQPFLATGVPAPIADNDPSGTLVTVDGSRQEVDQAGTAAVTEEQGDGPAVRFAIEHTFVGDLSVRIVVAGSDGRVVCSIPVLAPDPDDDSDDLAGFVAVDACAELLPPSPEQNWILDVVDEAALDTGSIVEFAVLDADGTELSSDADLPAEIPDDDPAGAGAIAS
jgi:subtilisin-like proprotein convertase family protein